MSEAKSIIKLRTSKGERFVQQLPRMVGEILSTKVMTQSSLNRMREFDEALLMAARNENDILTILRLIEQSHLCNGTTITRADIDKAENEVRGLKLHEAETIGVYTRRATAALKKAIALNLTTTLVGITSVYYYAFGLRDHRCNEVRTKVVEWTTKYNENNLQDLPVSVQAAHTAIKSIMSNVQYVELVPTETTLAMERGRARYEDEQEQRMPSRRQRVFSPGGNNVRFSTPHRSNYNQGYNSNQGYRPPASNVSSQQQQGNQQWRSQASTYQGATLATRAAQPQTNGNESSRQALRREAGARAATINQRIRENDHLPKVNSANTCYICGNVGHWARECPHRQTHDTYVLDAYYDDLEQDETVEQEQDTYIPVNNDEQCYAIHLPPELLEELSCYSIETDRMRTRSTRINLDNHSTVHIFHNEALLQNVHNMRIPIAVNGAGTLQITQAGYHPLLGLVYYSPHFKHNIISLSMMNEIGYYEQKSLMDKDMYSHLIDPISGHQLTFTRYDGKFYSIDARELCKETCKHEYVCIPAEISTTQIFTKLQRDRAEMAHRMHVLMYHPSDDTLGMLLDHSGVINSQITSTDLHNARTLYGPCRECSEAKPRAGPLPNRKRHDNTDSIVGTEIQSDIVIVNGKPKLITIVKDITYGVYSPLNDKSKTAVMDAMKDHIARIETPYKKIRKIVTDNDKTFLAMEEDMTQLGVEMNYAIPYEHCKRIERYVRNIRIKITIIQSSVPFKIPSPWYDYCIPDVIAKLNHTPNKHTTPSTPAMFVNGERLNANTMKATFGQCVLVAAGSDKASTYRYRAIVLRADTLSDGYYVWVYETGQILLRRVEEYITTTPIDIINKINNMANNVNMKPEDIIIYKENKYAEEVAHEDINANAGGTTHADDNTNAGGTTHADDNTNAGGITHADDNTNAGGTTHADDNTNAGGITHAEETTNSNNHQPNHTHDSGVNESIKEDLVEQQLRRSNRERVPNTRYNTFAVEQDTNNMIAQGRRAEIKQLMDNKTWRPIHNKHERTPSIHNIVLRCIMIMREKYNMDGSIDRIKGRLCTMGCDTDPEAYEVFAKTAPTMDNMTYMSLVNYAVAAKQHIEVFDVTAAFVQSSLDIDKRHVVILPKEVIPYVLEIAPEYEHYLQPNGTILVELNKSLYGLPEAGRVWYEHYAKILIGLGYQRSEADRCCYKKHTEGSSLLVGMHVDDCILVYNDASKWLRDELYVALDKNNIQYKHNILTRTNPIQFLQITMELLPDGSIMLHQTPKMRKMFEDDALLNQLKERINPTPIVPTLMPGGDEPCDDKNTYLSYLMKLYHIAHKFRYDLLNACSMLSCIDNPTKQDWSHLMHLYGYVKRTINYGLHINPGEITNEIHISADSAFAVHINDSHKSHTGYIIYYGSSPIHAKSKKQTVVCDSSSYAELIAMHTSINPGMFVRSIFEFIGINNLLIVIHQDNTQSIRISYDTTATNHKYMDIKHSYIQDLIQRQIIHIKYESGNDIVSDILASRRHGTHFEKKRQNLGIKPFN